MVAKSGRRDPREIERELETHRTRIASTLEELEQRLTPEQLLDGTLSYLREGPAGHYVRNLRHTVGENPVPITLVGIGLAWLAVAGRRQGGRRPEERIATTTPSPPVAPHATRHPPESTTAQTERGRDSARLPVQRFEHVVMELVHEHPLLTGLAAAALGALFGAAVPQVRTEAPSRPASTSRVRERAAQAGKRARRAAEAVAEASGEQAARPPDADAEAALSAAEAAVRAARGTTEKGAAEESRPS